jgi:hypothetical protein
MVSRLTPKFLVVTALSILLGANPPKQTPESPMVPTYCRVKLLRVVDGDTVEGDIQMPWGITLTNQMIRADYDTWESRNVQRSTGPVVDAAEVTKGIAATAELKTLTTHGILYVTPLRGGPERDNFGRVLAQFYISPNNGRNELISVKDHMTKKGHIRGSNNVTGGN